MVDVLRLSTLVLPADGSMTLKRQGERALPCAGLPINAYLFAWLEIAVDVLEDQV
jgi:hypothetical protein